MESPKIKILLEKYWSGNSNLEEEAELKRFYQNGIPESEKQYKIWFNYTETLQANTTDFDLSFLDEAIENKPTKSNQNNKKSWWIPASVAASLVVMMMSVSYQWKDIPVVTVEKNTNIANDSVATAYEETVMALAFLAEKLNQGNASIYQLSSFDKATKKVIHEEN
jgi:hypothetical protein